MCDFQVGDKVKFFNVGGVITGQGECNVNADSRFPVKMKSFFLILWDGAPRSVPFAEDDAFLLVLVARNCQMTKTEYRQARRVLRSNGRYGLAFLSEKHRAIMDYFLTIQDSADRLAERADVVSYCRREGFTCNPRQTA